MANKVDEADVFALPDFWQTSKLLEHIEADATSHFSFFTKDITSDDLNTDSTLIAIPSTAPSQHGFFQFPGHEAGADAPTVEEDEEEQSPPESEHPASIPESDDETEDASDMWINPVIPVDLVPVIRTWDSFTTGKPITTNEPMFLSEAGPTAYDALLCSESDPLGLENAGVPIIDIKTYLSSLLALALGGESVLFAREESQNLKPTLPMMRVSGYSADVLLGLENQCQTCSAALADLHRFVQFAYSTHPSRCGVALASTVSQIIQVVQEWVATSGRNPRSILQLQSTINAVLAILSPFQSLTSQLHRGLSDEDILTLVFRQSYAVDNNEEYLRQIMREVLRRVSGPWIEFLEEWIGTRREEGLPLTKTNVGESKGFVKVQAKVFMDDFGRETEEVDFSLDQEKVPRFMPDDVTDTIFETGRNLRFIRSFHPDHPLAQPGLISSSRPPKAEWLYEWDAILRLESRVDEYRKSLLEAIQSSRHESSNSALDVSLPSEPNAVFQFNLFGFDQLDLEERIQASIEQFSQPIGNAETEDPLGKIVRDRLSGTHKPGIELSNSTPHWSLLPVLSFGSIASAQAQVVNKEALRLLFTAHGLRDHLRLQREFQLLGNGNFWGVMGLRLGGRDSWPPASSELRLALMGILAESYEAKTGLKPDISQGAFNGSSELPGDMSFAVRDLSDEEIDKCMNPDSLEALDFLRLSYTTPPQLTCIITPMSLMQYDRIFKLLLRVLRMLFVVDQLFRDVVMSWRWEDAGDIVYRFVRESQHFVSSIAAYFLDTGVAVPWKMFEERLDKIQASLDRPDSSSDELQSPDRLRELHSLVIDRILLSLFLRQRQQPVLKLLEDIFNTVLQFAKYVRLQSLGRGAEVEDSQGPTTLYKEFRKEVKVFITVCRGLGEKARRTGDKRLEQDRSLREQFGTGDDSMIAQLLAKLDMFDYYLKR
ncbi:hypothetical protein PT974_00831 [Cladobotryum mycophilum]|uniref:Spindle pole body component n=1 Tax=Cladobotryum mycophilum TaxID=491253 RepID=A0ABR0T255_9HYPO